MLLLSFPLVLAGFKLSEVTAENVGPTVGLDAAERPTAQLLMLLPNKEVVVVVVASPSFYTFSSCVVAQGFEVIEPLCYCR